MAMQRAQEEVENQFEDISGYRCIHCGDVLNTEDGQGRIDHLLNCMEYIKVKSPEALEGMQRFDLSISANKTYPGKLVVQEGTEDEIVQGIKEILRTHSTERNLTKINIWNHSIAENPRSWN